MAPIGDVGDAIQRTGEAVGDMVEAGADVVDVGGSGVGDVADGIADSVRDGASSVFDEDTFELDTLKDVGESIFEDSKGLLSGTESLGGIVGGAVDELGLPDWAGDLTAAAIDFGTMRYTSAVEYGSSGFSEIAEAAGHEGVADFLDTTSDVTGMFNDVVGQAAMAYASGGAGAEGLLMEAGQAGQLGQLGEVVGQAGELAGHADTAIDVAGAFGDGNLVEAGTSAFDLMGNNAGDIGALVGDGLDGQFVDAFQGITADSGDLVGEVLAEFADGDRLSELPAHEILEQLGRGPDDVAGMAETVVDVAEFAADRGTETTTGIGSEILESAAGQEFVEGLVEQIGDVEVSVAAGDFEVTSDQLVRETMSTAMGLVDVADHDAAIANEIAEILIEIDSMSSSAAVSDMVGAQMRC